MVDGNLRVSRRLEFTVTQSALVTGAHGFVGAQLCKLLVERNWRVVAAHRRADWQPGVAAVQFEYLPLLSDPKAWQKSLQSIDCVVHLAARVHQMQRGGVWDSAFHEMNVEGSRFVAEQCVRAGVKRLVFLSTAKVNGEGNDSRAYRAEDQPDPQDAYARSKLGAEVAIRSICEKAGLEFAIIRPPLVYGPGVRANFRRLMKIAELGLPLPLGSVDNRRSLLGVVNLVDFIVTCMAHPRATGQVWLISDGEDISTPDLIRRMARFMRRSAWLFPCPPALVKAMASVIGRGAEAARLCDSFMLDAKPATEILEWKPPLSLDEGLGQTVVDYVMHRKA